MVTVLVHQCRRVLVADGKVQLHSALERNVLLRSNVSHFGDQSDQRLHLLARLRLIKSSFNYREGCHHYRVPLMRKPLPELLRYERHERMKQPQARLEHIGNPLARVSDLS